MRASRTCFPSLRSPLAPLSHGKAGGDGGTWEQRSGRKVIMVVYSFPPRAEKPGGQEPPKRIFFHLWEAPITGAWGAHQIWNVPRD